MLPGTITALYGSLFAFFYLFLAFRVIKLRHHHKRGVGDGEHQDLSLAIRTHANANEQGPLTLILLLCFELMQGPAWAIHSLGGLFVLSRVLHYFGLGFHPGTSFGRFYGTALNFLIIMTLSLANIWGFIKPYL